MSSPPHYSAGSSFWGHVMLYPDPGRAGAGPAGVQGSEGFGASRVEVEGTALLWRRVPRAGLDKVENWLNL